MRIQKIFSIIALSILTGCTDFLDVVPDNIATIEMALIIEQMLRNT